MRVVQDLAGVERGAAGHARLAQLLDTVAYAASNRSRFFRRLIACPGAAGRILG